MEAEDTCTTCRGHKERTTLEISVKKQRKIKKFTKKGILVKVAGQAKPVKMSEKELEENYMKYLLSTFSSNVRKQRKAKAKTKE